ncbi:hypothetical protein BKA70DRAFT_1434489 [Coprinopsis sp. MPI-PUGE-AT-0042]|nr:hypothetical protein BKA70DRAFT_1434489 [Coprinopsis sp. MPI-PUGE-AT-0042]
MGFTALTYAAQDCQTSIARALLQLEGVDVNLENGGRTLLMKPLTYFYNTPTLDINAKDRHGMTAAAYAAAKGVIRTVPDVLLYVLQSSDDLPARPNGHQHVPRWMGPLHEIPELAVHLQLEEHPGNEPLGTLARIVVTGRQSPYPPGFRLSSPIPWLMREEEYRRCLKHLEELGLGFPWQYGWISERHAHWARLLLKHPNIDDHGFAFLQQLVGSEDNNPSPPLLPSPPPSPDW